MSTQELPSGGGAYERKADGSLEQVEAPTAPEAADAGNPIDVGGAVEVPLEGAVERPAKRSTVKEA